MKNILVLLITLILGALAFLFLWFQFDVAVVVIADAVCSFKVEQLGERWKDKLEPNNEEKRRGFLYVTQGQREREKCYKFAPPRLFLGQLNQWFP